MISDTPLVSICAICYNRKDEILAGIERILEVDYENIEVIIADNHSTDGTVSEIERRFPMVRLFKMPRNKGIEAYNAAFGCARGKYIVIIDDDSFPEKTSIRRMVQKFEADAQLGVAAFDVRNFYTYDQVKNDLAPDESRAAPQPGYLTSFNGAGAGIRQDLFERVGFYPGEFFLYWNETDTAFRVLDSGYKISFFPELIAYHKYSPINRTSERAPFFYTRNMFWIVWMHFPFLEAVKKTINFVYLCLYHSLEQGTWVYIRAMLCAFGGIGKSLAKRKPVKPEVWKNMRITFGASFTFYK